MRHKKIIFLYAGLVTCVLLSGLFLNSCKQDEVVSAPTLSVFGPSPALRGGVVKFVGTNLDKVTSIMLPNNIEVKDITKTSATEISITIPQETKPGVVTLKSASGDITTKTPLTFSEPISIDTYTTTAVKAGDVFTISGDYLNLVAQVIFSDGAAVDSSKFISKSRKELKVYVPKAAKTGKVAVSNGATIPVVVYSLGNATVTDPTTLTSISPVPVKPGENLTIAGTYLNLVKQVILPDGNKIDSAAITVNSAKTAITVTVPLTAKEGVVKMRTYSGLEITSTAVMKLVGPAITSAAPLLVKNGETLTIAGTNLDLVTTAVFGTAEGKIATQSATSITVTVPMTAVDGAVVLNTNSGLTATSAALTLVKPTFTSITPLALTAGEKVTIAGTDLDLVRKVIFLGGSVAVTPAIGATSLEVTVPTTCAGIGAVTLETVNGTKVASTDQLAIKAATTPAIISITASVAPGGLMTIKGKNLNFVESIYFDDNVKAILYGVRTETSITVYVPVEAKHGQTTFTMNSFVGEKIVSDKFIYGTDPVTDPSYVFFDFDSKGSWWGSYGAVENNTDLSLTGKYFRINQNLPSGWVDFFWRNGQDNLKVTGVTVADWAIKMDVNVLGGTTPKFKFRLNGTDGDFWAIIPGFENKGGWYTVTIPLTNFKDADGFGTKILPSVQNISKEFGLATGGDAGSVNMCIDNIRFEKISGAANGPRFKLIGM
jgi:hypothetical protein